MIRFTKQTDHGPASIQSPSHRQTVVLGDEDDSVGVGVVAARITSSGGVRQSPVCVPPDIDRKEAAMRKWLFRFGWAVLFMLPVLYAVQILLTRMSLTP